MTHWRSLTARTLVYIIWYLFKFKMTNIVQRCSAEAQFSKTRTTFIWRKDYGTNFRHRFSILLEHFCKCYHHTYSLASSRENAYVHTNFGKRFSPIYCILWIKWLLYSKNELKIWRKSSVKRTFELYNVNSKVSKIGKKGHSIKLQAQWSFSSKQS